MIKTDFNNPIGNTVKFLKYTDDCFEKCPMSGARLEFREPTRKYMCSLECEYCQENQEPCEIKEVCLLSK